MGGGASKGTSAAQGDEAGEEDTYHDEEHYEDDEHGEQHYEDEQRYYDSQDAETAHGAIPALGRRKCCGCGGREWGGTCAASCTSYGAPRMDERRGRGHGGEEKARTT